ncbi:MAG TPA: hypothetical protein PKN13_13900 [Accumulibacter sp.]|nr:hypothetical protein [Accumulibacter sp.]HMW19012.1 hypothetical protein [Accumulibacter sp.]HMX23310.1 hypothetical protein [Accumulibacter sp.]HNC19043.1 hypothetical protein [Accumulibacter sp.]HND79610.1 hypothetical protein [Accumulibacter sp.]
MQFLRRLFPRLTPFRAVAGCRVLIAVLWLSSAGPAGAELLRCHLEYGGESRLLTAAPTESPYTVPTQAVGSYFLFRMVLQNRPADLAAIKLYVFADRDGGPLPLLQATYRYPPLPSPGSGESRYGFTGLHQVYEPVRDGELTFWCEWSPEAAP